MKYDFIFQNPTKIYFGKDSLDNLEYELKKYGDNIMLAYGKGAIKKNGLYDKVIAILKKSKKNIIEFSGIMPNPTYEKMLEGGKLAKDNKIDLILAVGGGSVIDCAKGVGVIACADKDPWQHYWVEEGPIINQIIPVASILTMTGTASEMNGGAVITNTEKKIKKGRRFPPKAFPKFSILNPEFTYSVSQYQMVSGIFDIMSHLMEQYFSGDDDNVTDYLIEGLFKNIIKNTSVALKEPTNYEARSNIMWAATLGLNYLLGCGKEQDWQVHQIEHQLGAYTDCAHGMGLAAITIPYFKHIYKDGLHKFVRFAKEVWGIDGNDKSEEEIALQGIDALAKFIKESKMTTTLKELGASKEMLPLIAESTTIKGSYKILNANDILSILEMCYE